MQEPQTPNKNDNFTTTIQKNDPFLSNKEDLQRGFVMKSWMKCRRMRRGTWCLNSDIH